MNKKEIGDIIYFVMLLPILVAVFSFILIIDIVIIPYLAICRLLLYFFIEKHNRNSLLRHMFRDSFEFTRLIKDGLL